MRRLLAVSDADSRVKRIWPRRARTRAGREGTVESVAQRIFAGLAGSYDRTVDYATLLQDRRWKRWVAGKMGGGGGLTLDIGCGTLLLEERFDFTDRKFIGLDLSKEMIAVGLSKELGNVPLIVNGDAESLPFPSGSFDSVVSCYVAKYVRTSRFAEELARVTRAGAVVAIYDFARPRGPFAPFLELYIQGGLRLAGALLGVARRGSAFTYSNLPRIIDGSTWDNEMAEEMERNGFSTVAAERLTGGAVFAYCGLRTPGDARNARTDNRSAAVGGEGPGMPGHHHP